MCQSAALCMSSRESTRASLDHVLIEVTCEKASMAAKSSWCSYANSNLGRAVSALLDTVHAMRHRSVGDIAICVKPAISAPDSLCSITCKGLPLMLRCAGEATAGTSLPVTARICGSDQLAWASEMTSGRSACIILWAHRTKREVEAAAASAVVTDLCLPLMHHSPSRAAQVLAVAVHQSGGFIGTN